MKKADENRARMVTRTIEQIENRGITKAERERLKRVAALPDDQIDTSDIPEVKDRVGWVRVHQHPEHPLHRVLSRLLSIRLPEPDIALAQRLPRERDCRPNANDLCRARRRRLSIARSTERLPPCCQYKTRASLKNKSGLLAHAHRKEHGINASKFLSIENS
jgi:hypothetical protein